MKVVGTDTDGGSSTASLLDGELAQLVQDTKYKLETKKLGMDAVYKIAESYVKPNAHQ